MANQKVFSSSSPGSPAISLTSHLPGPENFVADALLRPSHISSDIPMISVFNISLLPLLQITCPSISEMCLFLPSPRFLFLSLPRCCFLSLPQDFYNLWFLFSSNVSSSTCCMTSNIRVFVPLGDCSLQSFFGLVSLVTWDFAPG